MSQLKSVKLVPIVALLALTIASVTAGEAKLMRRSHNFDTAHSDEYADEGALRANHRSGPRGGAMATGERVVIKVRGAVDHSDGTAPSKLAIEDQPHRGPLPRGVYERLDGHAEGGISALDSGRYPRTHHDSHDLDHSRGR